MNRDGDAAARHALVSGGQAVHEGAEVLRSGGHEVDPFVSRGDRLADVVLGAAIVGIAETGIDDAVLQLDQLPLGAEVLSLRESQQRREPLGAGGRGRDVLDLERGLRLLRVQVAERALQEFRRVTGRDPPAACRQVGRHEVSQGFGAADRRTESTIPEEIVVDSLAADSPCRFNRVVRVPLQQVDVVPLLQVVQRELPVRQELVEKPQPPGVLAGRSRPDVDQQVVLRHHPEQRGQDREVRSVVLEGEFQMIAQPAAGPVAEWEELLDSAIT